jgi:tryptophan halogenase
MYRFGRIIDFLKLHYVLTQRTDTSFWRDNVDPASVPERLQDLLTLWTYQSPWFFDELDRLEEVFPAASYQYVLYGMGFRTHLEAARPRYTASAAAQQAFKQLRQIGQQAVADLPTHRALIDRVYRDGFAERTTAATERLARESPAGTAVSGGARHR